jgi:hypothetical protein
MEWFLSSSTGIQSTGNAKIKNITSSQRPLGKCHKCNFRQNIIGNGGYWIITTPTNIIWICNACITEYNIVLDDSTDICYYCSFKKYKGVCLQCQKLKIGKFNPKNCY